MLLDDLNAALTEPVAARHVRRQLERQRSVLRRMGVERLGELPDVDAVVEERASGLEEAYLEEKLPDAQVFDEESIICAFQRYVQGQRRLNELHQLLTPGDHVTARALERAPTGRPEQRKQHAKLRDLEVDPNKEPAWLPIFALLSSRTF